ncbi:MAG: hypothetical protein EOP23_03270 [Hyphomicrobiales bacterium]|nr:MAG: hypothetical protein EOP23_03270 [Hyphomicrobiales bacterium]
MAFAEALLLLVPLSFCEPGFTGFVNGRLIGRLMIGFDMACSFEQTGRQAPGRLGNTRKPTKNQYLVSGNRRFAAAMVQEYGKFCPANAAESEAPDHPRQH